MNPDPNSEFTELERRLEAERPVPRAGFRAELRSSILRAGPGGARPARLRLLIASYAGGGLSLILVAAVGIAGAGPFAA